MEEGEPEPTISTTENNDTLSHNKSSLENLEQEIRTKVSEIISDRDVYHLSCETNQAFSHQPSNKYVIPFIRDLFASTKQYIALTVNDQDNAQKTTVLITVCMEFYRILMGSLLLSFVPQKCGNHVCGITENLDEPGAYYIVYILNLMTLITFAIVYLVEIKRENRLITYLDVNITKPTDAMSVALNLQRLPTQKKENILYIDKIYQQVGCCAIAIYVFNTVISAIVIYDNYLDNKTVTAFLTNVLFMGSKVSEVYSIANTENSIFYSSYLKNKVQYNDVDPDKVAQLTDEEFGQSISGSQEEY